MKNKRIQYFILLLFFLMSLFMYSQARRNGPPLPKPNGPGPYPELPIDGGVTFLLIIGTAFGVYKLKEK
jgi:hypothetical protein